MRAVLICCFLVIAGLAPASTLSRGLEDTDDDPEDDYYAFNDDAVPAQSIADDFFSVQEERCAAFLTSFLESATDAHDICEGIMNAYTAADCSESDSMYKELHGYDDYFMDYAEHECCFEVMTQYQEFCIRSRDRRFSAQIFFTAALLLACECAIVLISKTSHHLEKVLIEPAICILAGGLVGGAFAMFLPNSTLWSQVSFDGELFVTMLLPPIILQASMSVDKQEFQRRFSGILVLSIVGPIVGTVGKGLMVHYISRCLRGQTFPILDSMVFGALMSSIYPLPSLRQPSNDENHATKEKDPTIFIVLFGESLLSDGIAIILFQTLAGRFDGKTNDQTIDSDDVFELITGFLISLFGSVAIGVACGYGACLYFRFLATKLSPVMEVASFFLWAPVPWYLSGEFLSLSGVISLGVFGFFMDAILAQENEDRTDDGRNEEFERSELLLGPALSSSCGVSLIRLSSEANGHLRFALQLVARFAEHAIFAYLGCFLFQGSMYDWDTILITVAIVACVGSRVFAVLFSAYALMAAHTLQEAADVVVSEDSKETAKTLSDPRKLAILVLGGLRGAVSLALVETLPIYNQQTGEGCEFKHIMKSMTVACILFTTFVFGGAAHCVFPLLGVRIE